MTQLEAQTQCLGIIAGEGSLPRQVVETCTAQNRPCCVLGLQGFFDPLTLPEGTPFTIVPCGRVEEGLAFLRQHKAEDLVFCGRVTRPKLKDLSVDRLGAKWLVRVMPHFFRDDGLLRAVAKEFENEGFSLLSVGDILASQDMISEGLLTSCSPSKEALEDIKRGFEVLHALGLQDVGQSIIVQQGIVLGIEAIEGTNSLIDRVSPYVDPQNAEAVLVKAAKKGQTRQADLPVVGPDTIDHGVQAGLKGMALEAGSVILIDRKNLIEKAEKEGFFIIGLQGQD
ncbi:MAG: LpxI family protein [bacterium]|nr:LpxI family protein [bacterium]